jgi:hypothetical protein
VLRDRVHQGSYASSGARHLGLDAHAQHRRRRRRRRPVDRLAGRDRSGVHRPMVGLAVRDERSDADDRVVDVLRELVADRLADLRVGLADEVVGGREPADVGHGLQVPVFNADCLDPNQRRLSLAAP